MCFAQNCSRLDKGRKGNGECKLHGWVWCQNFNQDLGRPIGICFTI